MTKSLRASLLGEQTAENDRKLLLPNFIETPEYRSIIETKDSTVVVGRRGTGKSAMYTKLSDFWGSQKSAQVISVAPEDYQTISFRSIFRPFESKYSHVRAVARLTWKYGLLLEMLSQLSKHFKSRERLEKFEIAQSEVSQWQSSSSDFFTRLTNKITPLVRAEKDPELFIGGLHQALKLNEIEFAFSSTLETSPTRFFVLIDRLDEGYENDEAGAAIVSGAIAVASELNKNFDRVRPVIFQRDNILRAVQKFDPDYTRNIEGEVIPIHWDTYQLQNLVVELKGPGSIYLYRSPPCVLINRAWPL
jgi:hypothetical protein